MNVLAADLTQDLLVRRANVGTLGVFLYIGAGGWNSAGFVKE